MEKEENKEKREKGIIFERERPKRKERKWRRKIKRERKKKTQSNQA